MKKTLINNVKISLLVITLIFLSTNVASSQTSNSQFYNVNEYKPQQNNSFNSNLKALPPLTNQTANINNNNNLVYDETPNQSTNTENQTPKNSNYNPYSYNNNSNNNSSSNYSTNNQYQNNNNNNNNPDANYQSKSNSYGDNNYSGSNYYGQTNPYSSSPYNGANPNDYYNYATEPNNPQQPYPLYLQKPVNEQNKGLKKKIITAAALTGVGAASGAMISKSHRSRNAVIGAGVGAVLGLILGR